MDATHTGADSSKEERDQRINDVAARIPACSGTALVLTTGQDTSQDTDAFECEARTNTRRAGTDASDREDISEVEYRQVRLEKVVLVGLHTTQSEKEAKSSLYELAVFAEAAGSRVLDGIIQRHVKSSPATYLGSNEAHELTDIVYGVEADVVIIDEELAPSQRHGLEDVVNAKVVDRAALILDTFAQHVRSREGKAQVEPVQFKYLLLCLRGWGESMSRQANGCIVGGVDIGLRGPSETKIGLDRRHIRARMAKLRADIARMGPVRRAQHNSHRCGAAPPATTVGYTNAGKSTLLGRLTDAGVLVQDTLLATLDPTVCRAHVVDGREYTPTDAVGFVHNLSTQLVKVFRSALGRVGQADTIVHVVDAAHPDPVFQVRAVRSIINMIEGTLEIPELIVLNRANLASSEQITLLRTVFLNAIPLSAHTGWGVEALCAIPGDMLPQPHVAIDTILSYSAGSLVHHIHEEGDVEHEEYVETSTHIVARVSEALAAVIAHEAVGDTVGDAAVNGE